ncbi:CPBP family intramembrane glutamic endopeptidase [Flavobacterium sp. SM2513]|uniref:CPBP family intramembrane glutamic endopeptidase n=1 Tax=Flavobacterium sp. SM2513 TaxID=3424766 RepID=UPI003D7F3A6D
MKKSLSITLIIIVAFMLVNILGKRLISEVLAEEFQLLGLALLRVLMLVFTLWLLFTDELVQWKYLFKNNLFFTSLSIGLIAISIYKVSNRILIEDRIITDFKHYSYFAQCLSVGFFEEFFSRVFVFARICYHFKYSSSKNIFSYVAISSIIFGFLHLTNLFNPSYDVLSVFTQIVFAIMIGFVFQTLLLTFKNILFVGALHALINYYGMLKTELFEVVSTDNESPIIAFRDSMIFLILIGVIIIPICYFTLRKNQNLLYGTHVSN